MFEERGVCPIQGIATKSFSKDFEAAVIALWHERGKEEYIQDICEKVKERDN
jgi:hypothetical protein